MPELPDITVYLERIEARFLGRPLTRLLFLSPFILRTVDPPPSALVGKRLTGTSRVGKRIVMGFEDDLFIVVHLMRAGRLKWVPPGGKPPGRISLVLFEFDEGAMVLTEAGSKRRASLYLARGAEAVAAHDPGGLEPLTADPATFAERLKSERHTLKRSLTDPHLFAGIGNAYSDEILHRARLSPVKMSTQLDEAEIARLHRAIIEVMNEWTDRLRVQTGEDFPREVTAFRAEMAAHGKHGKPCPVCGTPIQRIKYADSETNYCPECQTGGRLLADRALSRLLRSDWPKTLDELDELKRTKAIAPPAGVGGSAPAPGEKPALAARGGALARAPGEKPALAARGGAPARAPGEKLALAARGGAPARAPGEKPQLAARRGAETEADSEASREERPRAKSAKAERVPGAKPALAPRRRAASDVEAAMDPVAPPEERRRPKGEKAERAPGAKPALAPRGGAVVEVDAGLGGPRQERPRAEGAKAEGVRGTKPALAPAKKKRAEVAGTAIAAIGPRKKKSRPSGEAESEAPPATDGAKPTRDRGKRS